MDCHHGKAIIFGEYTVITNGSALAVPVTRLYGCLKKGGNGHAGNSNFQLSEFYNYLLHLHLPGNISLDLNRLEKDITEGLYFHSNVPVGYGAGSSGMLTAAVFSNYYNSHEKLSLSQLKNTLAMMEAFFHGNSSGIDPLVSFLNQPIRISPDGIILVDCLPTEIMSHIFLLDTGISRKTQPLVEWYKHRLKNPDFTAAMNIYSSGIDHVIDTLLEGNKSEFENIFKSVSEFQLGWWKKLIPDEIINLWKTGLKTDSYYIKICGAGGGGYMLLYQKEILPETERPLLPLT